MVNGLQQFPFLRECMNDVIRDFLLESLRPTEAMVESHIETQVILVRVFVFGLSVVRIKIT